MAVYSPIFTTVAGNIVFIHNYLHGFTSQINQQLKNSDSNSRHAPVFLDDQCRFMPVSSRDPFPGEFRCRSLVIITTCNLW